MTDEQKPAEQESETPRLTAEQIERIRLWLDRRCFLDKEMNTLCDMALSALTARERDALDAKRYRWLRSMDSGYDAVQFIEDNVGDELDAAIDCALSSTGGSNT